MQLGGEVPGKIVNQGNLVVGNDLSLWGGSITSKGKLAAPMGNLIVEAVVGDVQVRDVRAHTAKLSARNNLILEESQLGTTGNLSLLAGDTVRVRDSSVNPFVVQAGGKLLVQGNQGIDIFALNHPGSGFASGGDMVLRSSNTVGGDAHYWSGGSFKIENLDGNLGDLYSPYDPIIRSQGNVSFDSYTGASLHIFAGGSVTIPGDITITSEDTLENSIQETVKLSDNKTVVDIDGNSVPTLDIRTGTTVVNSNETIPTNPTGFSPTSLELSQEKTSADITIGKVSNPGGTVFLTNQYNPDITLPGGVIKVDEIDTSSTTGDGGRVTIDSRTDIEVSNNINTSSSDNDLSLPLPMFGNTSNGSAESADGGAITLRANGNISTGNLNTSSSANAVSFAIIGNDSNASAKSGNGGAINLQANGNISTGNISSSSFALTINSETNANLGEVFSFISNGDISNLINNNISGDINIADFIGNISGDGGDISMEAQSLQFGDIDSVGRLGGKITLDSKSKLNIDDNNIILGITTGEDKGKGGNINLTAPSISLTNFAGVANLTLFGQAEGGNINVNAAEKVEIINKEDAIFSGNTDFSIESLIGIIFPGNDSSSNSTESNLLVEVFKGALNATGIGSLTAAGSSGNAGDLTIDTKELIISKQDNQQEPVPSVIFTEPVVGATTTAFPGSRFNAGNLNISLSASKGDAGNLTINADRIDISGNETERFIPTPERSLAELILDISAGLTSVTQGSGEGGEIEVNTRLLTMRNGAGITTGTTSERKDAGEGERLKITASDEITLSGKAALASEKAGSGNAGDIILNTDKLSLEKGDFIDADTVG